MSTKVFDFKVTSQTILAKKTTSKYSDMSSFVCFYLIGLLRIAASHCQPVSCLFSFLFSGSDAASIQTRATLSEDGKHYLINGSKVTHIHFAKRTKKNLSQHVPTPVERLFEFLVRSLVFSFGFQTEASQTS